MLQLPEGILPLLREFTGSIACDALNGSGIFYSVLLNIKDDGAVEINTGKVNTVRLFGSISFPLE